MFFISLLDKLKKSHINKRKILWAVSVSAGVLIIALLAVWAVYKVSSVPSKAHCDKFPEYSLVASTDFEREQFFAQFGYSAESVAQNSVCIPEGGEVFEQYNNIQLRQGLDLRPYMGLQAHQYILRIYTQKQQRELYGVLTVYKDRVVAVHLTSFDPKEEIRGIAD